MDEQRFRDELTAQGYAVGEVREWAPDTFNDTHTHDFSARLLILGGEITVTTADRTTTCRAGDTFQLAAGIPHSERIGPEGVRFLSGRK